ncbi:MAG: hypothetical protein ACSHXY_13540 [Alphaproteobacteria bacterium]
MQGIQDNADIFLRAVFLAGFTFHVFDDTLARLLQNSSKWTANHQQPRITDILSIGLLSRSQKAKVWLISELR